METKLETQLFERTKKQTEIVKIPAVLEAATELYDTGLNVFVQPFASKEGYPWKQLQNVRLQRGDLVELIESWLNGRCNLAVLTGRTSRNLFILDAETPECFNRLCKMVKQANIPLWAVQSSRGGHIYLLSRQGEVKNASEVENWTDLEIRGNGVYCICPPSVHPDTGVFYQWIAQESDDIPEVELSDITFLSLELAKSKKRENPQTIINDRIEEVSNAKKGTRNRTLNTAAYAIGKVENYDRATVEKELEAAAVECGYVSAHGLNQTRKVIQEGLNAGERDSGKSGIYKDKRIEAAELWLQNNPLTGRTKSVDTAIALALVYRAKCESGTCFRASYRELAELARVGFKTVGRSIERLEAAGFPLKRLPKVDISLFAFNEDIHSNVNDTVPTSCSNSVSFTSPNQKTDYLLQLERSLQDDTVERGALGKTGVIVYFNLLKFGGDSGIFPAELAKKSGLSARQIRYGLERIAAQAPGLVDKLPNGYRGNVNPSEFALAAKNANTTAEKRRLRHQLERAKRAFEKFKRAINPARFFEEQAAKKAEREAKKAACLLIRNLT